MTRREQTAKGAGETKENEYAGLKWTSTFGVYRTIVGGFLPLEFYYDSGDYKIKINSQTLKARAEDVPSAAGIAVKAAKIWIEKARKELETL